MKRLLLLLLLLVAVAADAAAAWVGVCDQLPQQQDIRKLGTALRPTGAAVTLVAAGEKLSGCEMVERAIDPARIRWATVISDSAAAALSGGVILKGAENGGILETIPLVESPRAAGPVPLPLKEELLPLAQAAVFGTEDRVRVQSGSAGIAVTCTPGNAAAGVLFRSASRFLPAGATLALRVEAEATSAFRIGVADEARDRSGDPVMLGTLNAGPSIVQFPLPPDVDAAHWRYWMIECPRSAGRLSLRSLQIEAPGSSRLSQRAMWIWEPEAWKTGSDKLLALLANNAADTVFITIPVVPDRTQVDAPGVLERFVARASERGIRVWAVIGDPRAVLPAERSIYIEMAGAYAAYNRSAPAASRLSGLQLDIEPYLNQGYDLDPQAWLSAYLALVAQVRTQAAMPLDVAVPFWWGRQSYRGGVLLDQLAPLVEVVSVMNYRTDRRQLLDFAEPFLEWGVRAQRRVRIGLEAGPIPDEPMRIYRPAREGELWLIPFSQGALMVLQDQAQANPAGRAYRYSHSLQSRGSNTSFHGDVGRMRRLLPDLEEIWRAWPSFGGVAIHGLDADQAP